MCEGGSVHSHHMHYYMEDTRGAALAIMSAFVTLSQTLEITNTSTPVEKYKWMDHHLTETRYLFLPRSERRAIKEYIQARTGLKRARVTELIARKKASGTVTRQKRTQPEFPRRYTPSDIGLLAKVDAAHCVLSGAATRRILHREFVTYGKVEYQKISHISVSHIYNLRHSTRYAHTGLVILKTSKTKKGILIGIRKKPIPGEKPGFLRVDSVHQGDLDKVKGVYHINLVDEVTQWEIIMTLQGISEQFLDAALKMALELFPFVIHGFHSDNGSEYINENVAEMLTHLLIEQTKSRARRSNDNALVETKNGAVIRKLFGHGHIPQWAAPLIDAFNRAYLDEYLNYHRPCGFATVSVNEKGKERKKYDIYRTPFEKLSSLLNWSQYLKPDVTPESLVKMAAAMSDTEYAEIMEKGRVTMFDNIRKLTGARV